LEHIQNLRRSRAILDELLAAREMAGLVLPSAIRELTNLHVSKWRHVVSDWQNYLWALLVVVAALSGVTFSFRSPLSDSNRFEVGYAISFLAVASAILCSWWVQLGRTRTALLLFVSRLFGRAVKDAGVPKKGWERSLQVARSIARELGITEPPVSLVYARVNRHELDPRTGDQVSVTEIPNGRQYRLSHDLNWKPVPTKVVAMVADGRVSGYFDVSDINDDEVLTAMKVASEGQPPTWEEWVVCGQLLNKRFKVV